MIKIWIANREGHSTVITESANQLSTKPDVVIVCVGGGGLLCGVVQGMKKAGWGDVPIVAMETKGADSYNAAVMAGELVTLPDITRYGSWICCRSVLVANTVFSFLLRFILSIFFGRDYLSW